MNLYLLSQTENRGYDTFDSCVVCAPNEEQAKTIHPRGDLNYVSGRGWIWCDYPYLRSELSMGVDRWSSPENVTATLIGVADPSVKAGVVIASFNAG
jgi:hypothetical protein